MTTVATPPHPTDAAAPARHRPSARRLAHYTLRSVIAVLTDWAFLAFIVAMPTTMYLFFAGIYGDQVSTAGPIVAALMMVTMATYGGLGAALNAGAQIQSERSSGWFRQLMLTALSPAQFVLAKILTAIAVLIPAHDEAATIGRCLASVRVAAAHPALLDEPVIAAVKTDEALTAALASPCSTIFLLASTLLTVDGLVHRIHDAGKLAVVHIDLVDGLSSREIAVDSLNALCHPDGIISTRPTLIRRARHRGLLTVQRAFILDSLSLTSLSGQLEQGKPDFVEILPGIMPRVIAEISARTQVPVIAGGLLRDKADVMAAMRAGAAAVSTSAPSLWDI